MTRVSVAVIACLALLLSPFSDWCAHNGKSTGDHPASSYAHTHVHAEHAAMLHQATTHAAAASDVAHHPHAGHDHGDDRDGGDCDTGCAFHGHCCWSYVAPGTAVLHLPPSVSRLRIGRVEPMHSAPGTQLHRPPISPV